jgi:hypothetical protein
MVTHTMFKAGLWCAAPPTLAPTCKYPNLVVR